MTKPLRISSANTHFFYKQNVPTYEENFPKFVIFQICRSTWLLHQLCKHVKYLLVANVVLTKGSPTRDFRLQVLFMNQSPPGPWVSHRGLSNFYENLRKYIRNIGVFAVVSDTGDKLFTSVNIIAGVVVTGGKWYCRCLWHRWLTLVAHLHRFHDTGD